MATPVRRLHPILTLTLAALPAAVEAQFPGHYPPGVEGIKGPSLPPPGLYLRDYNLFYTTDRYPGSGLNDFEATVYVNAPRLIYMTDLKILGAEYGMDVIVPFGSANVKGAGGLLTDSYFGLYDVQVEPLLLAWHFDRLDIGAGYSFWIPTGQSPDPRPPLPPGNAADLGKGFWSHMLTLGATWHVDPDKTWSVSALNRYEFHHEDDAGTRVGDSYTVEFGACKTLAKVVDLGVAGYYQAQVTDTTGQSGRASVLGIGPEVAVAFPRIMTFISLRWAHELEAHRRPEGDTVSLTLTKRF
jgi:hypothetical protein